MRDTHMHIQQLEKLYLFQLILLFLPPIEIYFFLITNYKFISPKRLLIINEENDYCYQHRQSLAGQRVRLPNLIFADLLDITNHCTRLKL